MIEFLSTHPTPVMWIATIVAVVVIVFMLLKKMDIKISLFLMGILLMYIALFVMKRDIAIKDFASTGATVLDPLQAIVVEFKAALTSYGFTILILCGYTVYMSSIGANNATVELLTKPISKIKSPYFLVPIVFLLGNLLSLVIPSASTLAVILLATLLPVLLETKMSVLTAAGIIATTATIIPTPLGSDNVAIAAELANSGLAQFSGLSVTDYVFKYHAIISIPTLIFIAVVHYFWQKHEDKKSGQTATASSLDLKDVQKFEGSKALKIIYGILPVLPIIVLLVSYIVQIIVKATAKIDVSINISVEVATLISFVVAIFCEIYRNKSGSKALASTEKFFSGMGTGMSVVALTVAAVIFVDGLKSIGLIDTLQTSMEGLKGSNLGFVLPLIMVGFTALIVLLSGSGTSLFFAMVPLMVPLSEAAGINPLALAIPMGLAGNLLRAVSPVSAVTTIVAGSVKESPLAVARRTSVPMIAGTVFMFILSMIVFL